MINSKQTTKDLRVRFESREPTVKAFLPEPNRWSRLAVESDSQAAKPDSPLAGVWLGIKDIFRTSEFDTRAGSRLPAAALAGSEAASVSTLKSAGCVVVGKTVTTEFAYFAPGATTNPIDAAHTPGGSSSGSAAAVAADLCELALGSQTIGSVIRPAAYCSIFGYKPSYDRIDKTDVIPLAPSLDHVGLFTRELGLMQRAAAVLSRNWDGSAPAVDAPRFAVPLGPYLDNGQPETIERFWALIRRLRKEGLVIEALDVMPDFDEIAARHRRILAYEAAQVHSTWFDEFGELYHRRTADLVRQGGLIEKARYAADLPGRHQLRERLTHTMREHGINFWLSPAAPGPAPRGLDRTGDPIMNLPWTHAGLPALNLPAGKIGHLPLGLQVCAGWYQDEMLLNIGQSLAERVATG